MNLSHSETMVLHKSMKDHQIKGKGISGLALMVTLTASENTYLTYPVRGALVILEQGTTLGINVAVFHRLEDDGRLGAPSRVVAPVFTYDGSRS